ncbi:hypothetical protein I2I11_07410 [Pontibacter sp. 172403-2]|uniref:hypothetical protein n=1 Tax=Pontibacter rufus TaxID=2791028 RepID=UPI0018AFFBAB|nr:hypothetical protein [Pontibacter sp. 172403-2]MBF9253115.1 hypothetical protein [Pontibacter sp. 172403-2]
MAKVYKPFILAVVVFLLAVLMHYLRTGFWHAGSVLVMTLLYIAGIVLALLAWVSQPEKENL